MFAAYRKLFSTFALVGALLGLLSTGVLAQDSGAPPPDAEPGAVGVSFVVLSGLDPAAAPGYGLEMREFTWEPGSYVTPHTHPAAFIICVTQGAIGFSIQSGAAIVTRGSQSGTPAPTETMDPDSEVTMQPGDCVAVEEGIIHTAWNASDETTITVETYLFDREKPGRTFVNAEGTPVP